MKQLFRLSYSISTTIVIVLSLIYLLKPAISKQMQNSKAHWKTLEVIDAHAHIGTFHGYDLSTPTLLKNIEEYGIRTALISNIDGSHLPGITNDLSEKAANDVTAQVVRTHPNLFRGILWTRPEDEGAKLLESVLEGTVDGSGKKIFVALKFHPEFNQINADDDKLNPYMDICNRHKIPAVFHSGGPRSYSAPEKIYALAKRFPKVAVVLYHMGFGTNHREAIKFAKEAKEKHDASLYLETAQVDPESVLFAIEQVGSDYVLFGTDATYFGRQHYGQYQDQIDLFKKRLPKEDLDKVLHGNAKRIFHI